MAFDKEEKEFLKQLFFEYDSSLDKKLDKKFSENNTKTLNAFEDLIDYKIERSEERMTNKMSEQHGEVMNTLDAFAGEIKTTREERETQAHQILRNTRRIEKLEKAVYK